MKRMKTVYKGLMACSAFLIVSACAVSLNDQPESQGFRAENQTSKSLTLADFSARRMRADVEFLADDYLKGRNTGSEEYEIAARYVAAQYKGLGLSPKGENNSFFQKVPFNTVELIPDSANMSFTVDGQTVSLEQKKDFLIGPKVRSMDFNISNDLVFAGYGIHAPALGYSDLENIDVDNKIVVIFSGTPADFDTVSRLHFRKETTKARALAERGAKGILTVSTSAIEKRFSFERMANNARESSFGWVSPDGSSKDLIGPSARISHSTAQLLFKGADQSFDQVLEAETSGVLKSFDLKGRLAMAAKSEVKESISSSNVVAMIEGSDPDLKDQYIVLSAHLDHIGVDETIEGDDKIRNGAMDNATGTSVLMEIARAYANNGLRPRRSIILLSVTAEERGLLGAEYWAEHSTVPLDKVVANVNLDMPVLLYNFADVVAFGAEFSSLADTTDRATARAGIVRSSDPIPEQGLFVRSDHYRFVERGIPSVFLATGFGETEDGQNGGEIFMNFLSTKYHSPADQPDLPINYNAGAKFAFVNWLILDEIANADAAPKWNSDSIFKDLR